jgi:enterochelin esterase-like enzyme
MRAATWLGAYTFLLAATPVGAGDQGGKADKSQEPKLAPAPPGFDAQRDGINRGKLQEVEYDSKIVGGKRKMGVYTPPGYARGHHYPVLYLLHGSAGYARGWTKKGVGADIILDNLHADQKVVPMLVVFPDGFARRPGDPGATSAFEDDLLKHVIPYVEAHYAVRPGRAGRALAGLSMGGNQSLEIGLKHLDTFAWVGAFSGDFSGPPADFVPDPDAARAQLRLLWLSCGDKDNRADGVQALHGYLDKKKVPHIYHIDAGGHEGRVWKNDLYLFSQLLFRDKPADACDESLAPEELLADFRIVRRALDEAHGGIYRYTSKAELDRLFNRGEESLRKPLSVLEFYRVLAPVVAAIKCGHTGVYLPKDFMKTYTATNGILPLQVRVLAGKVYVWRDLSGAPASLTGKEIRSINGVPASTIVEKMPTATSGDGDIQTNRMWRLGGWTFSSELLALLGLRGPYDLGLWDAKKREINVRLVGAARTRLEEMARARFPQDQGPRTAAELTFLDQGMIAVMRIHAFGGIVDAERKKTLREFYQESFGAMNKRGTKTLVLDVRDNGGGEDELGKLLLSYLLDRPFTYYDRLVINALEFPTLQQYANCPKVPKDRVEPMPNGKYRAREHSHPNLGLQQPGRPTFQGRVLMLINGGCFSTTAEFLSVAHYRKRATFIGEESGGGYYGNTSGPVPALTLPHTKLVVYVPLVAYYLAVNGQEAAGHGVLPDHPVHYTIEELLAGEDKELTLALDLARR